MDNTSRWIVIGCLNIKEKKTNNSENDMISLNDIMQIAQKLEKSNKHIYDHAKKTCKIWISCIQQCDIFYKFLVNIGDKNVSDPAFVNMQNLETRSILKEKEEGNLFTAHIIIKKETMEGKHLILFEKVSGIHMAILARYFTWIAKQNSDTEEFKCEIIGYASQTIREALKTGELEDIELIEYDRQEELDEETHFKEIKHKLNFKVGKKVSTETTKNILENIRDISRNFFKDEKTHMFIRIKTDTGQIKTTTINENKNGNDIMSANILEQAFVRHEKISGFDTKLSDNHKNLRDDVIKKMIDLTNNLGM